MLPPHWTDPAHLPLGVGIDLVTVSELRRIDEATGGVMVQRTFTEAERSAAAAAPDRYVYLAGRFAVKEAVFKALAHLTPAQTFDFRSVETLSRPDGSPVVTLTGQLSELLDSAGADRVLVSVTNEGDYAMAIAQIAGPAQSSEESGVRS